MMATAWVAAHQRSDAAVSLKTLGVRVAGNSKLFDRSEMMVGTYERVLSFLAEPSNWPLAMVPADVAAVLGGFGYAIPGESVVQLDAAA